MELKQTVLKTHSEQFILQDTEYYRYIFKKTEKIACAVFYILRSDQHIRLDDIVVTDLETSARTILDISLMSLQGTKVTVKDYASDLRFSLIELESRLKVANSAHVLSTDLLEVFVHEIDSIQRSLKQYIEPAVVHPLDTVSAQFDLAKERRQTRTRVESRVAIGETFASHTVSRRERVLGVLRDKGQATIKDICEVVTDCSEKTIQRELISLIKDNLIIREGERRWSKYRVL